MQGLVLRHLSLFIILLGLHLPYWVAGQTSPDNFFIQHYSLEQGLSSRSVKFAAQDAAGFLWIGTGYGLNRFDGYSFQRFSKEESGLNGNNIINIRCLKDHTLWYVSAEGGLGLMDWHTLQPLETKRPELNFPFDPTKIDILVAVNDSVIVVSNHPGENWRWSPADGWKAFGERNLGRIDGIIEVSENGSHFFHRGEGLWYLPPKVLDRSKMVLAGTMQFLRPWDENGVLIRLVDENDGQRGGHILRADPQGAHEIESMSQQLKQAVAPYEAAEMLQWPPYLSRAHDGYYLFNEKRIDFLDDQFHIVETNILQGESSRSFTTINQVITLGKVALVVTNNGFFILSRRPRHFRNYLTGSDAVDRISVRDIDRIGDSLIVGTYMGFFMMSPKSGATRHLKIGKHLDDEPWNLMGLSISNSKADDGKAKWLGEWAATLWSPHQGVKRYCLVPDGSGEVRNVIEEPGGKIWICTLLGGLFAADPLDKEAKHAFADTPEDPLNHTSVYGMEKASNGNWWICSSEGLVSYDPRTRQRQWFRFTPAGQKPFGVRVYDVHEDGEGMLWVGTQNRGLIKMNIATGEWTAYGHKDGLSNETIYKVVEDKHQRLWLSSDYGLMSIGKLDGRINVYHKEDGIGEEEFNSGAFFEDPDGRYYFGTVNGIVSFHPDSIQPTAQVQPPFRLISIRQLQGDSLTAATAQAWKPGETLELPSSGNDVEISFALLDWDAPGQAAYSYLVEGQSERWKYTSENTIRIDAWPSGDFKIRIRARTPRGNWLPEEIVIPVHVALPFYRSIWFILLVVSLPFFFVYVRFRNLKRRRIALEREVESRTEVIREDKARIEQQAQELAKLDEAKSRFFANVSHELRTPLTLILGPINAASQKLKSDDPVQHDLSIVKENSKKLLSSIEEMLDISRLEKGDLVLNLGPVHLGRFLEELTLPFSEEAHRRGLTFLRKVECKPDLVIQADHKGLWRILTNLLSNAFKFTDKNGTVTLEVLETQDNISFSVKDTGKGIAEAELPLIFERFYQAEEGKKYMAGGSGIGLSLARDYAELMQGHIEVESKRGVGSEFVFTMPKVHGALNMDALPLEPSQIAAASDLEDLSAPVLSRRHSLLIVEDNPQLATFLSSILAPDYEILLAGNGEEALLLLAEHREISLVLTDLMMPVMDGFALIHRLRTDPRFFSIPVMVLTARSGREERLLVLRAGVDDYITKPFDEEELKIRILNLLHHVEARNTLEPDGNDVDEAEEPGQALSPADLIWLQAIETFVRERVTDTRLSTDLLAEQFHQSVRTFTRNLNKLTGMGPGKYVQEIRLQVGRELLDSGKAGSIKQGALMSGFDTPAYFSKLFRQRFGKEPLARGNM